MWVHPRFDVKYLLDIGKHNIVLNNPSIFYLISFLHIDVHGLLQKDQITGVALHSQMNQHKRESQLNLFRSGKCPILLATDVAARGIHIKNVEYIINYDFCSSLEQVSSTTHAWHCYNYILSCRRLWSSFSISIWNENWYISTSIDAVEQGEIKLVDAPAMIKPNRMPLSIVSLIEKWHQWQAMLWNF